MHRIGRPADAPPDHASLDEVERWLRTRRTESAYSFEASGRMVWEQHSDGFEVEIPPEDHGRLRGNVFTHNHPRGWQYAADDPRRNGNSFSPDDVELASRMHLRELRAVAPGYRFVMQPGPGGGPIPGIARQMYEIAGLAWDREFNRGVIAGRIDPYAKIADRLHEIWTQLAPEMGIAYRREEMS